jgi:UDP-N-acetylmuramoyl-tripeptide--D-alanyl-D-alanine ligase
VRSPEAGIDMAWTERGFASRFSIEAPGLLPQPIAIQLALPGEHNRHNALAAAAAALLLGIPGAQIVKGLGQLQPVPGRLQCQRLADAWLVDDSYNANPDSLSAAIRVLATAPGRTTLVLGDMGELGPDALELHRALGAEAREAGISRFFGLGRLSAAAVEAFGPQGRHFAEREALVQALIDGWQADEAILVKGSRSAAMDLVVKALGQYWIDTQQQGHS